MTWKISPRFLRKNRKFPCPFWKNAVKLKTGKSLRGQQRYDIKLGILTQFYQDQGIDTAAFPLYDRGHTGSPACRLCSARLNSYELLRRQRSGLVPKLQQLFWPDFKHLGNGEEKLQGNGTADVGRFDGAHMLAADAHPLGQLLLGQPGVLAIICDVVAQFDKLFRMIKAVFSLFAHNTHLVNIVSWIKIS